MRTTAACLVDVYGTVLHGDFGALGIELPTLAGVSVDAWSTSFRDRDRDRAVTEGRLTMTEAFTEMVEVCGGIPTPELIERMVDLDRQLLIGVTSLYDDTVPFLEMLRRQGIPTAFVSNCAENTGPLLDHFGLTDLVDAVVLSCAVGAAKPNAAIYQLALDHLGVSAEDALFIDDQSHYCAGAAALGIRAIRICRGPLTEAQPDGATTISSLSQIEALL